MSIAFDSVAGVMISIILPTYNEAENIELALYAISKTLHDEHIEGEILVIDDNSPDGTAVIARELSSKCALRVHVRKDERGLASAVMKGFELAAGEICVVMDADLSHSPGEIPHMIRPIMEGKCDAVIGSRYILGAESRRWPLTRRLSSSTVAAGIRRNPCLQAYRTGRSKWERLASAETEKAS